MSVRTLKSCFALLVREVRRSWIMCRWRWGSSWINQHPANVFSFNPRTSFLMPSPLSSASKVNKPSSEAQRMAAGLLTAARRAVFICSALFIPGAVHRRALRPFISAARGVRRSLPLFQKEDYLKKRPICWARTFPVSNPPFNSRTAMLPLSTCTLWAALGLWDANVPERRTCQTPDNRDWRVTRARITAGQSIEYAPYICDDVAADIYKKSSNMSCIFNAFYYLS